MNICYGLFTGSKFTRDIMHNEKERRIVMQSNCNEVIIYKFKDDLVNVYGCRLFVVVDALAFRHSMAIDERGVLPKTLKRSLHLSSMVPPQVRRDVYYDELLHFVKLKAPI